MQYIVGESLSEYINLPMYLPYHAVEHCHDRVKAGQCSCTVTVTYLIETHKKCNLHVNHGTLKGDS